MGRIKITHDTKGHTLTVWWGNPDQEYLSTLTEDEVIVMKDWSGQVIGFEALHYHPEDSDHELLVETAIQPSI